MATEPPKDLREIELVKAEAAEIRALSCSCLDEMVNYSLTAMLRFVATAEGADDQLAVMIAYRHVFECIDSCRELLDEGCPGSAQILLRSAFEGLLTVSYIVEEDTYRRGYAWCVADLVRRRSRYRSMHPNHPAGMEMRALEMKEYGVPILGAISAERLDTEIQKLTMLLDKPGWKEAFEEFERTKKEYRRRPEWYSLYDGPKNLRELAKHLHHLHSYELFHRDWSSKIHAGVLAPVVSHVDGELEFTGLRELENLALWATIAIQIGFEALTVMIEQYRLEEMPSVKRWYDTEIKPSYGKLMEISDPRS